jgi:K(+)-stimulated pyrophosphate-energized sodium pump
MVEEVRRQFRTIPGIMEGTGKPEYDKCVAISTEASLKKMMLPGAIAIISPLIIGFVFGAEVLGGFLAGATVSGVLMGMFQNNAGGAWDNAKKSFETGVEINGEIFYKKSEPHKASVTGDTVGDPFKDTSGPSMNILIKLMSIVSLVIAPTLAHLHPAKMGTGEKIEQRIEMIINDSSAVVSKDSLAPVQMKVKIDAPNNQSKLLMEALTKVGFTKDGQVEIGFENGVLTIKGKTMDAATTAKYRDLLPKQQSTKYMFKEK